MRNLYPLIFAAVISLIISGIVILILRYLYRDWWRKKYVRWPVIAAPLAALFFLVVWALGVFVRVKSISYFGAATASAVFLLQLGLMISLAVSTVFNLLGGALVTLTHPGDPRKKKIAKDRRKFIKNVSAIFPAAALSSQLTGIVNSYVKINVPIIKLPVANLPDELRGMKIAHLSDSHLGHYKNLEDLEKVVEEIKDHSPDLVLVTGDIADDLTILEETNSIIANIKPPCGVFASVGNHEYYRGISTVKKTFEKSPFPMFINEGVVIEKEGQKIFIGGADDPVSLRRVNIDFLKQTVKKTLEAAPSDSFKILMSHRPRGLEPASKSGVNLVLAGHTHGGQVGISGQSLFENIWPELYIWGVYRKKNTTLYTSSGMGHWIPFRLGCPAEAPILILEKFNETGSV